MEISIGNPQLWKSKKKTQSKRSSSLFVLPRSFCSPPPFFFQRMAIKAVLNLHVLHVVQQSTAYLYLYPYTTCRAVHVPRVCAYTAVVYTVVCEVRGDFSSLSEWSLGTPQSHYYHCLQPPESVSSHPKGRYNMITRA